MRGKSKARSSIEIEFRGKAHSNDWFRAILKSIDKSEPPRPNRENLTLRTSMASPRIALHLKKNKSDSANYRTKGTLSISISAVTHYGIQHSHHSLSRWVCPNRYESKEGILSSAKLNPNAPSNLVSVTGS